MGMIGNSLAQGLISGANIQDGTVDTPDIKDSAVTTAKINDGAVTTAKITDANVTTAKIADANVTAAKLASGAAVSNIGYTPVNKAGDTMTGALQTTALKVGASTFQYPQGSAVSVASAGFLTDATIYAAGIRNDNTSVNNTAVGLAFGLGTDFNAFIAAEKNSSNATAATDLHFGSRPTDGGNFRKHMTVSQTGAVTKPLQPSIVAVMSADQTISGSTWTKVNIDTAIYSQGGMSLDATNKRIYVPVSGVYLVSYTAHSASDSSEYLYSGISVGGTFYFYGEGRRATGTGFTWKNDNQLGCAHLIKLTANSYVELNFYSSGGGTVSAGTSRSHLGIHLLS